MFSNPEIERIATIDVREDGFYVCISVFRNTLMDSGDKKRRPITTPVAIGPYWTNEAAEAARVAFIERGARPIVPPPS